MNKKFKYEIMMGLVFVFGFMLTATFVFAKDKEPEIKKINYRVQSNPKYNYTEKEISLVKSIEKNSNGVTYKLSIVNGHVVLTNTKTNKDKVVYANGDARGLAEINYYYYDATYIVIVTRSGELYANVFKNNEEDVYFRKVKLNNTINKLKVVEKDLKFYEHPAIELFGLDDKDNWELIKL